MSDPFGFLRDRRSEISDARQRSLVPRSVDGVHLIDGEGRRLLNFGSNDYLGFAMNSRGDRIEHASTAGSTASALVCGWSDQHQDLANLIADWEGSESAVLLPTGYAACFGTVATLPGSADVILSDALNHASLIDGCRMSKAPKYVYPHRDVPHVRQWLETHRPNYEQVWLVTDSIFSMDGDVAPLRELCDLADEFNVRMIVDEAHASGVFGKTGSGMCEELGVKERVHVRIGTLSKAIGSQGGFVAGPQPVIDTMINHCRMLIYSTSLSMGSVQHAHTNIHRIRQTDQQRQDVRLQAQRFRASIGAETAISVESQVPIIPIVLGTDERANRVSNSLRDEGYFVPAIRPPTVPAGTARLRISLSAAHSAEHVDALVDRLRSIEGANS